MNCNNCGKKLLKNDSFCSKCGKPLRSNSKNIFEGSNNRNNVTGDNNIIINPPQQNQNLVDMDYFREKKTKLPFSTSAVTATASLFSLAGLLGILANISQVLDLFNIKFDLPFNLSQPATIFLIIILIIGMLLFIFIFLLKRQGFIRLSSKKLGGRGINIESSNGRLFLSKIKANCPLCGGVVTLVDIGNQTVGICHTNRKQHIFEFDYTLLKDLNRKA